MEPKNLKIPKLFSGNFKFKDGVVKYPADVLRQMATDVTNAEEAEDVAKQMIEVVSKFSTGAGLAATQIGVTKRVICIRRNDEYWVIVNPVIAESSGTALSSEGCLSTPNLWGVVERYVDITITGVDTKFQPIVEKLSGFEAFVAQHEIDHLDGIMFFDRANPDTLIWSSKALGKSQPATFVKSG